MHTTPCSRGGDEGISWRPKLISINVSAWASGKRLLQSAGFDADVVVVQEHHLAGDDDIAEASSWAWQAGYSSVWAPAIGTEAGGTSGGVAVLVRRPFSLLRTRSSTEQQFRHRLVSCIAELGPLGQVAVCSVYLRVGSGLDDYNIKLLA